MNKTIGLLATLVIGISLSLGGISDAEAKRFGGARSFGSKSTYSSPYKRSSTSSTRTASQQQAYTQNQAARQSMAKRGGLMGMLGGLALGGLLGAMFFGGAFEGLNFMDMIIFGGIAYLLYKMFAAKAGQAQQPAYQRSQSSYSSMQDDKPQNQSAGFDTDMLFKKDKSAFSGETMQAQEQDADFSDPVEMPADFDQSAFLSGAKIAFKNLQDAWDKKDLAEIRGLTTDKVFVEIQEQIKATEGENHTQVLKLDAELLEVREIGNELEAVVLFDSIMREEVDTQAEQVREVWHFIKPKNSVQPKWYLDGIQQLEQ